MGPEGARNHPGGPVGAPRPEAPGVPQVRAAVTQTPSLAYGFFVLSYISVWGFFLLLMARLEVPWPGRIDGIDLLLLGLATFRLTELISEEKVARVLRAPFCERVTITHADGSTEEDEVPRGTGLRRMAGELILCPWCTGVWVATLLTFAWIAAPGIARLVLVAFAAAAAGLIFQIFAKLMDRTRKNMPEA